MCNPSFNTSNNRINSAGYAFDDAGNTTADPSGQVFTYDGENKQVLVTNGSGTVGQYWYDGDGKRIKKYVPGTGETTVFVYDAAGKEIAEYSTIVASSTTAKVNYLTADHLGSPRINTDANGSIIARHDYMPFGEEIGGTGGRTTGLNYSDDSVRNQFTGHERDQEIDLDFSDARYYNFNQGRFNSVDPLLSTGESQDPSTWNRYVYALNNPLYYTDPSGMYVCNGKPDQCKQFADRLAEAKGNLEKIKSTYGERSNEYKKALASVNSYGDDETGKKKNNGVFIKFDGKTRTETTARFDTNGKLTGPVTVHFKQGDLDVETSQSLVAHEGSHIDDDKTKGLRSEFDTEFDAHVVQSLFIEAQYPNDAISFPVGDPPKNYDIWNPAWLGPDKEILRANAVKDYLAVPKAQGGKYELTPPKPKASQANPRRRRN